MLHKQSSTISTTTSTSKPKEDEGVVIAVYGTLKQNESNHLLVKRAKGEFIDHGITCVRDFNMVGYGYPIVREGYGEQAGVQIKAELYRFKDEKTIADIDQLEGHPNWYCRKPFKFTTSKGSIVEAQMYVQEYNQDVFDQDVSRIHKWDNKPINYWSSKEVKDAA